MANCLTKRKTKKSDICFEQNVDCIFHQKCSQGMEKSNYYHDDRQKLSKLNWLNSKYFTLIIINLLTYLII